MGEVAFWEVISRASLALFPEVRNRNETESRLRLGGRSPQSCTETEFEMKTSIFVLFLLISVVSVHFRAIYDETIRCQA